MEIHLTHTHHYVPVPERHSPKSFGYDLAVLDDVVVGAGETKILPTGFALAFDLPFNTGGWTWAAMAPGEDATPGGSGVAMLVVPRSSLFLKHGLLIPNSPGLVDADYSGPIGVIVYNVRREPCLLAAGDRIAQLVFVRLLLPTLTLLPEASAARASRDGFGSTG